MTMKKVLMKTTTPIPTGPTGVCASANGGRMKEKNAPPIITSARLPATKASKSRSRATARKPRAPSLADGASARPPRDPRRELPGRTAARVRHRCDGRAADGRQTEFNFQVGNFNFHAGVYSWLVVNSFKAQYRG